jgi:squalene synthase HpnC
VSVDHYENFPVASWLCPPALRPPIVAIYRFARTADDIADEGDATPAERVADLDAFRTDLVAVAAARAPSPRWPEVFAPLARAIAEHRLPLALLGDLLDAFRQDALQTRYDDRAQLLDYCRRSANPIGRLLLHLYGVADAPSLARSDAICTALQLANFWQDVGVDLAKDRIYLPEEDRKHFGVSDEALYARIVTPQFRDLMRFEVARARSLFERGRPLIDKVGSDLGFELAMIWNGGMTILDKIEAVGYDVFRRRPTLGAADKARMVARAATQRWPQWVSAR